MKVAIVGSRKFPNEPLVRHYVKRLPLETEVVSGACRDSPDEWAVDEAKKRGMKWKEFPVDKRGLPAFGSKGFKGAYRARAFARTDHIVEYSDVLVAFWDGRSNGTKHGIETAQKAQIPWAIIKPDGKGDFDYMATDDPLNFYLELLDGN